MLQDLRKKSHSKADNLYISDNIITPAQFMSYQERLDHASALADMCNRLGTVYNSRDIVTPASILQLLNDAKWACVESGTRHAIYTPLTVVPIFAPNSAYYRNAVSNYRVVYRANLSIGEYRIRRATPAWLLELMEADSELQGVA